MTSRDLRTDEHDAFERPRRRTRPRTKDRPDYSAAEIATVVTVDRGRYRTVLDDRDVTATKARQLGRASVIVGDWVRIVGDTSGEPGTLARIVEVEERRTVLRRTADDDDPYERPIVANADQLVIVTALADPPPRTGMIDRILVAGYDAGLVPLLCLTKADLAAPDALVAQYAPLGVRISVMRPGADLTDLQSTLDGHRSVFVGHSGVGKSTLVNALIPGAKRAIGAVNAVTGRGRQTSTSAIALRLPEQHGLGDRHPRGPVLRSQPCTPGPDLVGLRGSGRPGPGLPARLHTCRYRARMRLGRGRRTGRTGTGSAGVVPADAAIRPVA